jgi:putative PIN family toxin of toxin-antitoxin system
VPLKRENFDLRDHTDNKVLDTAVIGNCNFLITGDKDLPLQNFNQFFAKK